MSSQLRRNSSSIEKPSPCGVKMVGSRHQRKLSYEDRNNSLLALKVKPIILEEPMTRVVKAESKTESVVTKLNQFHSRASDLPVTRMFKDESKSESLLNQTNQTKLSSRPNLLLHHIEPPKIQSSTQLNSSQSNSKLARQCQSCGMLYLSFHACS
jgi:hypothetical protein